MSTDKAAIEKAVQTYFDGLYEGDADKLASIFHPSSELTFAQEGKLVVWTRDQWLDNVRKRGSAKSKGSARDDAILHFDQSGPDTAFVKVKCQLPPLYFTDYLSFVKSDGAWKVAQKVFATVVRKD
ncbi:MAG TPA: nuclear transport factor 2 family protein [Rhodoblastus sp.]|nr:nuclear transport factor 2 family protein [Rhodoblastus sp.]